MSGPPILSVRQAAAALRRGEVVAYPTESVWGLGCDPFDESAVRRLLALKERPVEKGLIAVAATVEQLKPLVDFDALPPERLAVVLGSWPGPNTWVMPAGSAAPRWMTGRHDGIAVRVSAHPLVIALCEAFEGAIVSTSANPAGAPAPRVLRELDAGLCAALDGLVAGETSGRDRPSTIRDARSGEELRA